MRGWAELFLHFPRSLSLHGSECNPACNVRFEVWRSRGSTWNGDYWSRRLHHVELNFTWSKLGFSKGPHSWVILNIWLGGLTLNVSPESLILNSYYQKTHMKSKNRTSDLSWRHLINLGVATQFSAPQAWLVRLLIFGYVFLWDGTWVSREHRDAKFEGHVSCKKTQRKRHQTTSNRHPSTLRLPMISCNFLPPNCADRLSQRKAWPIV